MIKNEVTLRIKGNFGSEPLSPENFDISQLRVILEEVETLLYPDKTKRKNRVPISYEMKAGSVVNVFRTKDLYRVLAFSSMLAVIEIDKGSIDRLDANSAKSIETLQAFAVRNDFDLELSTGDNPARVFKITPYTHYIRHENILMDIEAYYYGILTDAGGKDKANIHLDTKDAGSLTIKADKEYLANYESNILYRKFGVRVRAKQNILTGDIDKSSLSLVELIDYEPKVNEEYLNNLIKKSTPKWKDVDADKWVAEIRGGMA